jgi:hypothetical protein
MNVRFEVRIQRGWGGLLLRTRLLWRSMLPSSRAPDKFLEARFRGRRCVPRSARDGARPGQSDGERIWTSTPHHRTRPMVCLPMY